MSTHRPTPSSAMRNPKERDGAGYTSTIHYRPLQDADPLGTFNGYELLKDYVPQGRYSSRAIAYVHVKLEGSRGIAFTQVSSVRRTLVEGRTDDNIERLLTHDAVARAESRILSRFFKKGEIYTVELTSEDIDT